ncbi:hypothetical protein Lfu02_57330 [Longispora fulva]|uniref:Uncharacterized protein n=1 Tax=Longispora fulva TaxID=619741 RepID=A0A8J7KKY0_9ACTN|nr:hypothetical protein [Longispora fulva]MBG6137286.1 hypothetical protein [Longispora fulva]GIG61361.1 hypothetical protein Lfu02_57330 [Longispora fulva]
MTTATTTPVRPAPPAPTLSVLRLNIMRIGYLLMSVGLAIVKWPALLHAERWTLFGGVVNCILVAMSILAFFGLRYPRQLLPLLLFESIWKVLWLGLVAIPLWTDGRLAGDTADVASDCLYVVIILAVIPWDHVYRQYLAQPGDPWWRRRAS